MSNECFSCHKPVNLDNRIVCECSKQVMHKKCKNKGTIVDMWNGSGQILDNRMLECHCGRIACPQCCLTCENCDTIWCKCDDQRLTCCQKD